LPGGIYKRTREGSNQILITEFDVENPYPNPFNPSVTIPFGIPAKGLVKFEIFDLQGRLVYSESKIFESGKHEFQWLATSNTGSSLSSGLYFCKVTSKNQIKLVRMLYTK